LYREERNGGVNGGGRIDNVPGIPPGADILLGPNPTALQQLVFAGIPGFTRTLQSRPHDAVHGLVGNLQGLGRVPWAPNDPIFWLHHCNLDRMWESWNQGGGENPCKGDPWRKEKLVFVAPDGAGAKRVEATVEDFERPGKLNYDCDVLEPGPSNPSKICSQQVSGGGAAVGSPQLIQSTTLAAAVLDGSIATLSSASGGAAAGGAAVATKPLGRQVLDAINNNQDILLLFENLPSYSDSSVFFNVFLESSGEASPKADTYVGSFNFFDGPEAHGVHGGAIPDGSSTIGLPASLVVRRLAVAGLADTTMITVRIQPSDPSAAPLRGQIRLVAASR
jgi:tyrosinase